MNPFGTVLCAVAGCLVFAMVLRAMRTGRFDTMQGSLRRDRSPRMFGFFVVFWLMAAAFLIGAAVLSGCKPEPADVTVRAVRLPTGAVFLLESPDHPDLQDLRRAESIDRVVAGAAGDLARISALAQWASKLFPSTTPFPHYPPWDARETLRYIRSGISGGFCAQYAIVFGQACQSIGYDVRYIDLKDPRGPTHFVTSVYVPDRSEWVVVDPSTGTYFTDAAGGLLDELEMHRAAVGESRTKVRMMPGGEPINRDYQRLYTNIRFYLRNNFLSVPVFVRFQTGGDGPPMLIEPYRLRWVDKCTKNTPEVNRSRPTSAPADFAFVPPPSETPVIVADGAKLLAAIEALPAGGHRAFRTTRGGVLKAVTALVDVPLYHPYFGADFD